MLARLASPVQEHVARTLCLASNQDNGCPICFAEKECTLWPTFMIEAGAAIEAVKDYNIVQRRDKPKVRHVFDIVRAIRKDMTDAR